MRNIFIFHGTGGSPDGNWFPWLKEKLEEEGLHVIVPKFPTPEGQSLSTWLNILNKYKEYINEETIFVGHSLGGMFLLKVLEQLKGHVSAAFFVSAPVGVRPIKYYDSDYAFTHFEFDWPSIIHKAKKFRAYHSDNDPYVSLGNGKELARRLGIELTFIPSAGHINAESGWIKFDKLYQDIEIVLKSYMA
ncbi:alpha/beta hydrolase [Patescibacteria group bacterium]|nr:alpha/beta hydrolase [Patescibacteria group bacterium]